MGIRHVKLLLQHPYLHILRCYLGRDADHCACPFGPRRPIRCAFGLYLNPLERIAVQPAEADTEGNQAARACPMAARAAFERCNAAETS